MPSLNKITGAAKTVLAGRGNSAAAVQALLTRLFMVALNASTSIIVARVLKPEGRGEMSALILWSGFLTGLLTLGLPSALVFNLRKKPENSSKLIGAGLLLSLCLAVLIALAGELAVPIWLSKYPPIDILYARWFLLSSPIPIALLAGRAALEADGKFTQSNMTLWSGPLITLTSLIVLAATHTLRPVTGGLAYVLGNVPAMLWIIWSLFLAYRPQFRGAGKSAYELLHYGVRCWGIDLLAALGAQADQLLVVKFLAPEAMGIYVVAASFAKLLNMFETSAVMILLPRVAARGRSEIISITGQALRITTLCAGLGAVVAGIVGPILLATIYGPEYADKGTTVFRILLAEVVLAGATQVLAQAFMASGRPGVVTTVQAVGVGIGLSLMPILIPMYGVAGAGIAMLTCTTIRFSLTWLCFRPLLKTAAPSILITRSDIAYVMDRIASFVPATAEVAQ